MRVLLVHNNYRVTGGAEVFYHEVGRILEFNGHEVAYFSCHEEGLSTAWSRYYPVAGEHRDLGLIGGIAGFPSMVYSKKAKHSMARVIDDFEPDIVHAFAIYVKLTPSVLDAATAAGIPIVMSCNDYKHICPNYKLYHHGRICEECKGGRFYRTVVNRCCHDSMIYSFASSMEAYVHGFMNIYRKNVHTFLFASEFMARKTEEFWGKESFRWRKLRNPFDSTKFEATYRTNGPVLYFGRLIDEKGIDILIQAAMFLPECSFRIVGDGPDAEKYKMVVAESGMKNIEFAGAKWGEEMDFELAACRFVVVPSVWHENFPYVINQAFAFGKPVVGSNRGGIPELVKNGERGLIYEASDPGALADAIRELWQTPARVEEMGRIAKTYADQEYNDSHFSQTLESIYEEVLS